MLDELCAPLASSWVQRWHSLIPASGWVLDLACGAGRHTAFLLQHGYRVLGVDRDLSAIQHLAHLPGIRLAQHDLERDSWPFAAENFDAIVVTNYLHRPLFVPIAAALKKNGVLIYETFARGNERFGKPSNPDFLLAPGELLDHARAGGLCVIAYEDLYVAEPKPAMVQRICAVRD